MLKKLEELKNKYNQLTKEIEKFACENKHQKIAELNKEQAKLQPAYELWQEYNEVAKQIEQTQQLIDDEELGEMAKTEIKELEIRKEQLEKEIKDYLTPKDEHDERDVLVEIRGAAGGDEANIFAGDIYRMYSKYADNQGWKVEILNAEEGVSGGYTLIQFLIKGLGVYGKLKFESGAHRVQRVPVTETQGRVHTSTATVLVIPKAEDADVSINPNDLKIDVFRSSGAGGQSVNTTDSAVRITHIPTGIIANCQQERSQIRNRERALQMLKAKLYEKIIQEKAEKEGTIRKNKIGSGDRSEKIRTYNYPQNRVTDHRINLTLKKLDRIMEGEIDEIINNLIIASDQDE